MATTTLTTNADTYVDQAAAATNNGTNAQLVANGDFSGSATKRFLVGFDFSSIPSNATVTLATLTLKDTLSGGAWACTVERVTGAWTELGATWNNQPAVTVTNAATFTANPGNSTAITVTNMVADMVTNGTSSVRVRLTTEAGTSLQIVYSSREGATAPTLAVTYTVPSTDMQMLL